MYIKCMLFKIIGVYYEMYDYELKEESAISYQSIDKTWIEFYNEFAMKLLKFREHREQLIQNVKRHIRLLILNCLL